ncbi:MAG: DUF2220 domain-containing protein, partial [Candidatus Eremiobacterota bacterium]
TDLSLLRDEFAAYVPSLERVFITENEVNLLAFPRLSNSLVIFGSGYSIETLDRAEWLKSREIYYWGDIDTHGFSILDRLRGHFPHTRAILMDRPTLLEHRPYWVREKKPTSVALHRLTPEEAELYADLVTGRYGQGVRLEQEMVRFPWVHRALEAATGCTR